MTILRIGQRRQIIIPKDIFQQMHLKEGDFVEITRQSDDEIVLKRKKLVDVNPKAHIESLPPAPSYEERLQLIKLLEGNATDDSEDIPIDKIVAARKSKKISIKLEE